MKWVSFRQYLWEYFVFSSDSCGDCWQLSHQCKLQMSGANLPRHLPNHKPSISLLNNTNNEFRRSSGIHPKSEQIGWVLSQTQCKLKGFRVHSQKNCRKSKKKWRSFNSSISSFLDVCPLGLTNSLNNIVKRRFRCRDKDDVYSRNAKDIKQSFFMRFSPKH